MNQKHLPEQWERTIQRLARQHDYPAIPDLAAAVISQLDKPGDGPHLTWRRLAPVLMVLVLIVGLVQPVRAALLEAIQVGAIRIFSLQTAPELLPTVSARISKPVRSHHR